MNKRNTEKKSSYVQAIDCSNNTNNFKSYKKTSPTNGTTHKLKSQFPNEIFDGPFESTISTEAILNDYKGSLSRGVVIVPGRNDLNTKVKLALSDDASVVDLNSPRPSTSQFSIKSSLDGVFTDEFPSVDTIDESALLNSPFLVVKEKSVTDNENPHSAMSSLLNSLPVGHNTANNTDPDTSSGSIDSSSCSSSGRDPIAKIISNHTTISCVSDNILPEISAQSKDLSMLRVGLNDLGEDFELVSYVKKFLQPPSSHKTGHHHDKHRRRCRREYDSDPFSLERVLEAHAITLERRPNTATGSGSGGGGAHSHSHSPTCRDPHAYIKMETVFPPV
eukprot:gene4637-9205_t